MGVKNAIFFRQRVNETKKVKNHWSREHLKTLISRQKWLRKKNNFEAGDIVFLVWSQWRLGKITRTYPDEKGLVHQVSVKTTTAEVKRPTHKLCLVVPANPTTANQNDCDNPAISVDIEKV